MSSWLDICHLIKLQHAVSPYKFDEDEALYWVFIVRAEELGSLTRCMASTASVD